MVALARARRHLDATAPDVTLIITGGLRTPADFAKALALGADGVAVSNAALQAIGCLGMRACHTNNCPVGIATQKEHLRARLPVDAAADRLERYFHSAVELMTVLRASVRPRQTVRVHDRRSHDLRSRRRRSHGNPLRRGALVEFLRIVLFVLQLWLGVGFLFGVAFVAFGVQRVDPASVGAKWGVRLLLIPGAMIFWPRLAWLWFGGRELVVERSAHRDAARGGD